MNVLGIESSGAIGSVAACRDGAVLAEERLEAGMEHGRMLVQLVDRVVSAAGWDKRREIDLVAVSQGPGSFTGLRVGIACAKTLAALSNKPIAGVCSLDAMARNAPPEQVRILTVLDAKRGDVYAAAYEREGGTFRRTLDPTVIKPIELRNVLTWPVYVMGDGTVQHEGEFQPPGFSIAPREEWRIRASTVARVGREQFESGRVDDPITLEPIYLRLAEAEEKRLARERGGA